MRSMLIKIQVTEKNKTRNPFGFCTKTLSGHLANHRSLQNIETEQSEELERLLDATNAAAADVRKKLKDMDKQNKEQKAGTAQWRIRSNMHGTLTKKFLDLMSEYQEVQTKYKNKYRERVARQYKIGNPMKKKKIKILEDKFSFFFLQNKPPQSTPKPPKKK